MSDSTAELAFYCERAMRSAADWMQAVEKVNYALKAAFDPPYSNCCLPTRYSSAYCRLIWFVAVATGERLVVEVS